jgi:class 3 adenylate cyclase
MERRLSAIFAADMVGYSRLMEADEVGHFNGRRFIVLNSSTPH